MATFTGTESDDTFTATSGADTFYFGENQGVDLIFRFDVSQDKLAYTDRSVDGFDDLEITRLSNGDAVIESNDQYTVLQGVDPDTLVDSDFVFTTSGPRGDISDSRSPVRRPPDDVDVRDIQRRERAAGYPTSTSSSGASSASTSGGSSFGRFGGLLGGAGSRLSGTFGDPGGSRIVDVTARGQTLTAAAFDIANNHDRRNTTFVFQPGDGQTLITQFRASGNGHDTLSLPRSDFTAIADVLHNTRATAAGAVIHDPTTGDTIRLAGVSKAELAHHRHDIALHG